MSSFNHNQLRFLYGAYKNLDKKIYAILDPMGQLRHVGFGEAVELAQRYVEKLSPEQRNPLCHILKKAITLREKCKAYFRFAPERKREGHDAYIAFLKLILDQLGAYQSNATNNEKEVVNATEQQPVVGVKEQLLAQGHLPSAEAECVDVEEAEDGETALTPDQADFLDFLELLMALTRKAASLWERVVKHQLPIWVASIEIRILLREAEHLINLAEVLNDYKWEGEPRPKGCFPWAVDLTAGGPHPPRLAKDWVDVLDNVRGVRATWRELATLPSLFWPCVTLIFPPSDNAAFNKIGGASAPFIFTALLYGIDALHKSGNPHFTSTAQVPLITLVGLYFYSLVDRDLLIGNTPKPETAEFLYKAREAVCTEMGENLDILPRLIKDGSVSEKDADAFRTMTNQMMARARACIEPISLGDIHVYSRVHWADWHGPIIASNSTLLQTFLYLCEKRRLQTRAAASATAGDQDSDGRRLLHALLEDSRIAPLLLMDGRPQTVQQCISALQKWCYVSTKDGEYCHPSEISHDVGRRVHLIERSCAARKVTPLSRDIIDNQYSLTKAARARLTAKEGADDESALERYLTWEMGVPNCLKLETALRNALQKTTSWVEMLVNAIRIHPDEHIRRRACEWEKACASVIDSGLHTVYNGSDVSLALGEFNVSVPLQAAIAGVALSVPSREESLKSALADAVHNISGWKDRFNAELFRAVLPLLRTSIVLDMKSLFENPEVELLACFLCLVPPDYSSKKEKGSKQHQRKERRRQRNEVIGNIFKDFMKEARPVLAQAYGENPDASPA